MAVAQEIVKSLTPRAAVAQWSWHDGDGNILGSVHRDICHNSVFYGQTGRYLALHVAIDTPDKAAYYTWMYGPSGPYRSLNVLGVYPSGIIFEAPLNNFVYNACIASRWPYEHAEHFAVWCDRVRAGVHPTLAYWAAYVPPNTSNPNPNHQSFDWMHVSSEYVQNLCNGEPKNVVVAEHPCNWVWGGPRPKQRWFGVKDAVSIINDEWPKLYPELMEDRLVPDPVTFGKSITISTPKSLEALNEILIEEEKRLGLTR